MTNNDDAHTATPTIPFASFASLRAAHSELLEREPESKADVKYFDTVEEFFHRARETGALMGDEEERRESQSILNYWLTVLYRVERQPKQVTLARLNPDLRPNLKDAECPYPGPREFTEKECKYFFGRYRQIEYLLARLKMESLLVLLGPSGSGKTSLVQAGLIPALRRLDSEDEPDSQKMYYFSGITPGRDPLNNLAAALEETKLVAEMTAEKYYEKLLASPGYLARLVRENLKMPVVMVIDQFEEIFTLCRDQRVREAFVDSLMELNDGRNKIIICMTDDDYNRELNKLPTLKDPFRRASTILPKLGMSELADTIVKPAEIVGLKFKENTVKDIVHEIANEPIGLPLLQFTLLELWEKRIGEETSDEFCRRMASCRQILSQSAELLFNGFNDEQKEVARKVLARLSTLKKSTPRLRAVLREDLERIEGSGRVLEAMEKAHIIHLTKAAQPSDVQVELVHESLLSGWSVMRQLVKGQELKRSAHRAATAVIVVLLIIGSVYFSHREYMRHEARVQERLKSAAAAKWAAESGKELAGERPDLAFLLGLAAYSADDNDNTRGALVDILRYSPRPKAFITPELERQGDIALSPDGTLLASNSADGSIIVWDLSRRHSPLFQITDKDAKKRETDINWFMPLAFSPDGRVLASGSTSVKGEEILSTVALWEVGTGRLLATLSGAGSAQLNFMTFTRDGRRVAVGDVGGDIYVWDLERVDEPKALLWKNRQVKEIDSSRDRPVNDLSFSANGISLAAGYEDGRAFVWDVEKGQTGPELTSECNCLEEAGAGIKKVTSLAFDSQGGRLFVGSTEDVVLYNIATGKPVSKLSSDQRGVYMYLSLSSDDRTLQGVDSRGGFYLWDVMKGKPARLIRKKLFKPMLAAWSFSFSRDGNTLALNGENGLSAWDLASQRPLFGHKDNVNEMAFSPDGRTLASAGNDGKVILWDTAGRKPNRELSNKGQAVVAAAFDHRGTLLAVESLSGSVVLWNVSDANDPEASLEMLGDLEGEQLKTSAVTFSPDDKTVISLSTYKSGNKFRVYVSSWDVGQRRPITAPSALPLPDGDKVTSAAFSHDGKILALATENDARSVVTLWDALSRTQIGSFQKELKLGVASLALSPDGSWIAAGQDEKSEIVLWNRLDGRAKVLSFEGQSGRVSKIAFSADGKILAASIDSGWESENEVGGSYPVVLWDIISDPPRQLGSAFSGHEFWTTALSFDPNGKLFAIADKSKSLTIWDMDIRGAKAIICGTVDRNRGFTKDELNKYKSVIDITNPCLDSAAPVGERATTP